MNGDKDDNVRSLPKEKYIALSEKNRWSLEFAEGYVSGEMERRRGNPLTSYVYVGIDQYALGFRAGYFKRNQVDRETDRPSRKRNIKQNGEQMLGSDLVLS